MRGGGMEYPMLVMDGNVSESLVFHEIAHNWFYGALANDERAEAWLDEGLADVHTRWYLTERYGPYGNRKEWNWYQRLTPQYTLAGDARRSVASLAHRGYGERIATRAEDFKHDYFTTVYDQASLMFDALRYVVGDDDFEKILKTYFERWKFKHVNEARFQAVCEEVSGTNLDWFFEEWLHTKKICDYRPCGDDDVTSEEIGGYETYVRIERLGELTMPLLLRIHVRRRLAGHGERFRPVENDRADVLPPEEAERGRAQPRERDPRRRHDEQFSSRAPRAPDRLAAERLPSRRRVSRSGTVRSRGTTTSTARVSGSTSRGAIPTRSPRRVRGLLRSEERPARLVSAALEVPSLFFGDKTRLRVSGLQAGGKGRWDHRSPLHEEKRALAPADARVHRGVQLPRAERPSGTRRIPSGTRPASIWLPYFRYTANPQFDLFGSAIDLGLRLGRDWFDADYKYTRFETSLSLATRPLFVPDRRAVPVLLGNRRQYGPLPAEVLSGRGRAARRREGVLPEKSGRDSRRRELPRGRERKPPRVL